MRNIRPAFALLLILAIQSLCALPGQGQQTPTPGGSIPVTSSTATSVPELTTVPGEVAEAPRGESVGTINLVLAQVQSGPPENLQFLEGLQDFYDGDSVRVTGGGKGQLNLNDGTELTLFNETRASGVTVKAEPPEARLFLENQGLLGEVKENGWVEVMLPNGAMILIRGTHFFILFNNATEVATTGNFDGMVFYTPPGGTEQELPPGRMVEIPAQGAVELMELPFTPEQFEAAAGNATTPIGGLSTLVQEYQIQPIVFTGEEVGRMTHAMISAAAFSPDGRYVVSGGCERLLDDDFFEDDCEQGGVRVWEASGGGEVQRMIQGQYVNSVAFSPDGQYVVSGSCDDPSNVCYGRNGGDGGSARVWEISTRKEISSMIHEAPVWAVAFSQDGNHVRSVDYDGTIRVWEAFTNGVVAEMVVAEMDQLLLDSLAFIPDSMYVVSGSNDGITHVWDLQTSSELARKEHEVAWAGASINVAVSPDGKYVASGIGTHWGIGKVPGTNFARGASPGNKIALEGRLHERSFYSYVNYDVSRLSRPRRTQDAPNPIIVWEPTTGIEFARLDTEGMVVASSLVFSPDGRYLAAGLNNLGSLLERSGSGMVTVWEIASGREVARMNLDSPVQSVDFSPDGDYVVFGTDDGNIRLLDAFTGREVAHMSHAKQVLSVDFSPDGKYVLAASVDGVVRVWRWETN